MTNNNEEGGEMKRGVVFGLVFPVMFVLGNHAKAEDCLHIGNTPVCVGMKKKAVINALVEEYDMQAKMEGDGKASEDIWLLRAKSGVLGEQMKGIIEFHDGRVKSAYKSWGSFDSADQLFDVVFQLLMKSTEEGKGKPEISLHEIPLKPGADWKQIKIKFSAKEIEIKKITDRDGAVIVLDENLKSD
jgi:hypothetical protein